MLANLASDRKAAFVDLLRTIVAELGDHAHPHLVWQHFQAAKAGGSSKGAVKGRLDLMARVTSEHETLTGQMELDALHLVIMEDDFAVGPVLVPFQTAAMNAVLKGAPAGRMLLIVVEELGKLANFPEAAAFFEQNIREARHGLVSWLLGAHLVADLTPASVGLANGVVQFGGTNLADLRRLRELRPEFAYVDLYEMIEQATGYATCAFGDVSDPAQRGKAVPAVLRPSCVHAGGETMQVG